MQSPFDACARAACRPWAQRAGIRADKGKLLLRRGRNHFVQTRFAPIRGVAVNDAPLGSLIDGRNKHVNFLRGWLGRAPNAFLQCA